MKKTTLSLLALLLINESANAALTDYLKTYVCCCCFNESGQVQDTELQLLLNMGNQSKKESKPIISEDHKSQSNKESKPIIPEDPKSQSKEELEALIVRTQQNLLAAKRGMGQ